MEYEAITRKQKFFKALATALLMPVAVLVGASLGTIIAVLAGVLIYGALIFHGLRWGARHAFAFAKSFGKSARTGEVSEGKNENIRPEPPTAACGLPGGFSATYSAKGDPGAAIPDPPEVRSASFIPPHRKWLQ